MGEHTSKNGLAASARFTHWGAWQPHCPATLLNVPYRSNQRRRFSDGYQPDPTNSLVQCQVCPVPGRYAKVNSEKLLIIGCGDIGHRLAERLSPDHYQITGLRRHPPAPNPRVHYLAADAADPVALASALTESFDVVVITLTPSQRTEAGYHQAYVLSCQNLVQALGRQTQPPRLVIFVSSTSVYGQTGGEWVDEHS